MSTVTEVRVFRGVARLSFDDAAPLKVRLKHFKAMPLAAGDDVDVEAIVDNMMEIQREIGLKMYEYGWYFAKGGDGIHKV